MALGRMLRLSDLELPNKRESQVQQEMLGDKEAFEGGVNKNNWDTAQVAEDEK